MARKPKKPKRGDKRALVEQAGRTLSGAGLAAAMAPSPGTATLAALLVMFPSLVGLAAGRLFDRARRRMESWWDQVVRRHGHAGDDVRLLLEGTDAPYLDETIVESIRRLLEITDDAVVPGLGALAAEYIAAQRRPDRFFRGLARTLADLDADEYAGLRLMFSGLARVELPADLPKLKRLIVVSEGDVVEVKYEMTAKQIASLARDGAPRPTLGKIPHGERLLHLLYVHELGSRPPDVFGGFGSQAVCVDVETVRRLNKLLNE